MEINQESFEAPRGKVLILRKHLPGKKTVPSKSQGVLVRLVLDLLPTTSFASIHAKRARDKFSDFNTIASGSERLICQANWLCKPEMWVLDRIEEINETNVFCGYPSPKVSCEFCFSCCPFELGVQRRDIAVNWNHSSLLTSHLDPRVLHSGHIMTIHLDTGKKSYKPDRDEIHIMAICGVAVRTGLPYYEVRHFDCVFIAY